MDAVNAEVKRLQVSSQEIQENASAAADQHKARLLGIQQLKETMTEMEEEAGSELLQRVLDGHVKKLHEFSATEMQLRNSLEEVTKKLEFSLARHRALEEHLQDLTRGGEGLVLHPHPQRNDLEDKTLQSTSTITLNAVSCSVCLEGFPYGDFLFCSCEHVYHPWCAAHWFKSHSTCAVNDCGPVHPLWSMSWGFGDGTHIEKQAPEDPPASAGLSVRAACSPFVTVNTIPILGKSVTPTL